MTQFPAQPLNSPASFPWSRRGPQERVLIAVKRSYGFLLTQSHSEIRQCTDPVTRLPSKLACVEACVAGRINVSLASSPFSARLRSSSAKTYARANNSTGYAGSLKISLPAYAGYLNMNHFETLIVICL